MLHSSVIVGSVRPAEPRAALAYKKTKMTGRASDLDDWVASLTKGTPDDARAHVRSAITRPPIRWVHMRWSATLHKV